MTNLIEEIAKRKLTEEFYPVDDDDEITYEWLVDRNNILDLIIEQARKTKPVTVTITADGGIQVDNPDGLPISIRDYDSVEFLESEFGGNLEQFGGSARQDGDNEWYIERGNQ